MKRLGPLLFVLLPFLAAGQDLGNFGNIRLHNGAQMGLHANVINNGNFGALTQTLLGFYGTNGSFVEGINEISTYDVEFGNQLSTIFRVDLNVFNNANFISGNVSTPLNGSVSINFNNNAFYTGTSDANKVIGYVAKTNTDEFTFPVGDVTELRPLLLRSNATDGFARCAYLRENIENSFSTGLSFDTGEVAGGVGNVSNSEFWILEGDKTSTITLSWNERSGMDQLVNDVSEILIVGWSLSTNRWIALSEPTGVGDLTQGIISSNEFLPSDYGALTFGTTPRPLDTFAVNNPTLGDYFLSPNADGVNDGLVFDNLEDTGANMVRIYNKFGQKVFEQQNYTNEFRGFANTGMLIFKQEIGLPEGVYYYTIDLMDLDLAYQGFLFLNR